MILNTFLPENVSVPEEIILEIFSETAFLHGRWEELIQKHGPQGAHGPHGPLGPHWPLGPLGSHGPMGPWAIQN